VIVSFPVTTPSTIHSGIVLVASVFNLWDLYYHRDKSKNEILIIVIVRLRRRTFLSCHVVVT